MPCMWRGRHLDRKQKEVGLRETGRKRPGPLCTSFTLAKEG